MATPINFLMSVIDGKVQGAVGNAIAVNPDGDTTVIPNTSSTDDTSGSNTSPGGEGGLSPGLISIPSGVGSTSSTSNNNGNYFPNANRLDFNGGNLGGVRLDSYESLVSYFSTAKRDVNSLIFGWTNTFQDETLDGLGESNIGDNPAGVDLSGLSPQQRAFAQKITPGVIAASKRTGVDPRIIYGQAILESGSGSSWLARNANAIFGIKNFTGTPAGPATGLVRRVDRAEGSNDYYNSYNNWSDSIIGYSELINRSSRYSGVRSGSTFEAQARALGASGYATDPNYGSKVASIGSKIRINHELLGTKPGVVTDGSAGVSTTNPSNAHIYVMEDATIRVGLSLETESTFGNDNHGVGSIKVAVVGGKVGSAKSAGIGANPGNAYVPTTETSHQTIEDEQWNSMNKIVKAFRHVHPHGNVFGADELSRTNTTNSPVDTIALTNQLMSKTPPQPGEG